MYGQQHNARYWQEHSGKVHKYKNLPICTYQRMCVHMCEVCMHAMVFMNTTHTGMLSHGHMRVHTAVVYVRMRGTSH